MTTPISVQPQQPYESVPYFRSAMGGGYVPPQVGIDMLSPSSAQRVVSAPGSFLGTSWNNFLTQGGNHGAPGAFDSEGLDFSGIENDITFQYVARSWSDEKHVLIVTGDLVFGCRSKSQASGSTTILNIGSLNYLLRQGYSENQQLLKEHLTDEKVSIKNLSETDIFGYRQYDGWVKKQSDQLLTSPDASSTLAIKKLSNIRENCMMEEIDKEINRIKREFSSTNNISKPDRFLSEQISENLEKLNGWCQKEVELHERSLKFWKDKIALQSRGLRYLHLGAIMDHWNFLGVVRSSNNDQGYIERYRNNAHGHGVTLSVSVAKKVPVVFNIWSNDLDVGDDLYLILKRSQDFNTGEWGAFQVYPFSNGKQLPTAEDLEYVDYSGTVQLGTYFYVGMLAESLRNAIRPQEKRKVAAGIMSGQTAKDAFDAIVLLDKIVVHLKV